MKKSEAYKILELSETATIEEIKKQFKKLAAKFHPDVNKNSDAEEQFKKINDAYQRIEKNDFSDNQVGTWSSGFGGGFDFAHLEDLFGFGSKGNKYKTRNHYVVQDIYLEKTISFKESVLGVNKNITYTCDNMCYDCNGNGDKQIDNGCKECGGTGIKTKQQGMMFFRETCRSCKGKTITEPCAKCSTTGKISINRSVSVSIQPGTKNNTTLRLAGMGHFAGPMIGNSNVLLHIKVIPEKNLTLEDNDVITNVNISLLEALKGCSKTVNTIDGEQTIDIPALIKNKEEVILSKLGVERVGNERVIVNISYPKEIETLIQTLEKE